MVAGELDLHGVVKPLTCRVRLALSPDGVLTIATEFPVRLSDHAIARPGFLTMKLADTGQFGGPMPDGGPFWTAAELELVRVWIAGGALDD